MNLPLRITFGLAGAALAVGLFGACYQAISNHLDSINFPEPGRLVRAGSGLRLQFHCTGAGKPVVVLEAGLGDGILEWGRVEPEIAKFTRVCAYDRAGYGGSDPGPMPRSSLQIAGELHQGLQNAGEQPPYLLVGHSFGGYNARVFNGLSSDQVVGMVLVDSTQEDQYDLLPKWWNGPGRALLARYQSQARWAPLFIDLGAARLWLRSKGIHERGTYLVLQSKFVRARSSELEYIRISAEQARSAGHIADKPLTVLTAGKADSSLANDSEDFQKIWINELQPRLMRLSSRGKRVIVEDSGHDIPNQRPDAIVEAVREMVQSRPNASSTLPQPPVNRP